MDDLSELISCAEAGQRIGVSRKSIYNWITRGVVSKRSGRVLHLPYVQVGGVYRIHPETLRAFMVDVNGGPEPPEPKRKRSRSSRAAAERKRFDEVVRAVRGKG